MKGILVAAAALLAVTPALAEVDNLSCFMVDGKNNSIAYLFERVPGGLVELSFGKNGSILYHSEDNRPVWSLTYKNGVNFATYRPDPRFIMGIGTKEFSFKGAPAVKALVLDAKTKSIVASGACMKSEDLTQRPEFRLD